MDYIFEYIFSGIFFFILALSVYAFYKADKNKKSIVKEIDFEFDFVDVHGNYYHKSEHRNKSYLIKTENLGDFISMSRQAKTSFLLKREADVKSGKLDKIEVNGAILYQIKNKPWKELVDLNNSKNEKF